MTFPDLFQVDFQFHTGVELHRGAYLLEHLEFIEWKLANELFRDYIGEFVPDFLLEILLGLKFGQLLGEHAEGPDKGDQRLNVDLGVWVLREVSTRYFDNVGLTHGEETLGNVHHGAALFHQP